MIVIFGAREKAKEDEGEGIGCNVKQGKGNNHVGILGRLLQQGMKKGWPTTVVGATEVAGREGQHRGINDKLETKKAAIVGLKERKRRQRVGAVGKRALGSTSGWRAARAAVDVIVVGKP
ncbi:hypothetical protein BHM03_00008008 [Ensete ventricosum]|nr:hypothetical protein BHM03_00008008 [Ensete ventricosum]